LQLFSFGGYGLALAALALVVFGAYDSQQVWDYLKQALVWVAQDIMRNPPRCNSLRDTCKMMHYRPRRKYIGLFLSHRAAAILRRRFEMKKCP